METKELPKAHQQIIDWLCKHDPSEPVPQKLIESLEKVVRWRLSCGWQPTFDKEDWLGRLARASGVSCEKADKS